MNIDDFERTKPRETYKAIRDLKKYVQDMLDAKEPWHPNDTIEVISKKLKDLEGKFLRGD